MTDPTNDASAPDEGLSLSDMAGCGVVAVFFGVPLIAILLFVVVALSFCGGCLRVVPYAQAIEIALDEPSDRQDLERILQDHARIEGVQFIDSSERWASIAEDVTLQIGLLRPGSRSSEVSVTNRSHLAHTWVLFIDAWAPDEAPLARQRLMQALRNRWPDLREIPVLPSGGVPLREHLALTPKGYTLSAEAAPWYADAMQPWSRDACPGALSGNHVRG